MGCGDFGPPPPPGKTSWGQHDLVIRRSTDSGSSWGQLTTLLDAIDFPPWKKISATGKPDNGNAIWDPSPLWDSKTDTVWLFFNGPGREGSGPGGLNGDCLAGLCSTWETHSTDKGISWTTPANMTLQCQRPGVRAGSRAGNSPGNGHGVQLSSGRLVVPMYSGDPPSASVCYSDDHGKCDAHACTRMRCARRCAY